MNLIILIAIALFASNAQSEDCADGLSYNSTLNRCLTSAQTAQVMNAVTNCNGDMACYKQNAEDALSQAESDGSVQQTMQDASGLVNSSLQIASIVGPTLATIQMLSSAGKCPATSAIIMTGAGVVAFAGDKLANSAHKKRLSKIKEEWSTIVEDAEEDSTDTTTETDSDVTKAKATEAQSQAFEMLAKSEESMSTAAKTKAGIYAVAGAGFAAGAVIAALEMMKPTDQKCINRTGYSPKWFQNKQLGNNDLALIIANDKSFSEKRSPTLEEYEADKESISGFNFSPELVNEIKYILVKTNNFLSFIPEAQAAGSPLNILETPTTRMVLGGILATWSVTMSIHAAKQASISKKRAAYLRNMKEEFNDATTAIGCTTAQRSDPTYPSCYCYTSDGERNADRSASTICTNLFNGITTTTDSTTYLTSTSTGCITTSGAEDAECTCTTTSTCSSIGTLTYSSGLDTGTLSLTNGTLTSLDSVSSGTLDAATVDTSTTSSNAARLLAAANSIAAKSKTGQSALKNKTALASQLENALQANAASSGYNSNSADTSSTLPKTAAEAVAALQKEIEVSKSGPTAVNGNTAIANPSSSAKEEFLDFSLQKDQKKTATEVAEVMKQNFDYDQEDISKRVDDNLFDIVSNRYRSSALKRLFQTKD